MRVAKKNEAKQWTNWTAMCALVAGSQCIMETEVEAFVLWSSASFFIIKLPRTWGHPQHNREADTHTEKTPRLPVSRAVVSWTAATCHHSTQQGSGVILLPASKMLSPFISMAISKAKSYMCRKLIQGSLLNLFSSQKIFYSTYHTESSNTYMEH